MAPFHFGEVGCPSTWSISGPTGQGKDPASYTSSHTIFACLPPTHKPRHSIYGLESPGVTLRSEGASHSLQVGASPLLPPFSDCSHTRPLSLSCPVNHCIRPDKSLALSWHQSPHVPRHHPTTSSLTHPCDRRPSRTGVASHAGRLPASPAALRTAHGLG